MKRSEDPTFLRWAQVGLSEIVRTGAPLRMLRNRFDLASRARGTVTEEDCDTAEGAIRNSRMGNADWESSQK